jgi:hypothetical protein
MPSGDASELTPPGAGMIARNSHQRLDYEAVLRPSRWARGMQVVGALPDHVAAQLSLPGICHSVWLHEGTVVHICERANVAPADSEFVLEWMPAAVLHPMFCGIERRGETTRVSLVEYVRAARRYIFLGLRVARSAHADDELWVSTGHPMSEATLRRYLRSGRLEAVQGRRLEGGKTRTARRLERVATQMP